MSSPPQGLWSAIDAILVINLDRRADRWAEMQAHLASLVPTEKIHRMPAVLGSALPGSGEGRWFRRTTRAATWAGRAGCTLSHRNAIRLAREHGWRRILILEDDARLDPRLNTGAGRQLAAWLERASVRPRVCYLGYTSPRGPARVLTGLDDTHRLYAIRGGSTTHAYIIEAPLYQPLLDLLPATDKQAWDWVARHTAIDRWYSLVLNRLARVTAVSPQLAVQAVSHSDITQREAAYVESDTGDELAALRPRLLPAPLAGALAALGEHLGCLPRTGKYLLRQIRGF